MKSTKKSELANVSSSPRRKILTKEIHYIISEIHGVGACICAAAFTR